MPGVVETPPPGGSSLGSEILLEFRTLTTLLTPGLVLYLMAVFFVALGARRGIGWITKLAWRLGADPRHRLSRVKGGLDLGVVLLATVVAARPFFVAVPLVSSIGLAVFGLVVAVALPEWVQSLVAGLSLTRRAQFREGDRIEVGDVEGAVERMGLLRTVLRASDGSSVSVPNRDIVRRAIRVGGELSAVPVTIELPPETSGTSAARERARRLAWLSPYRRAGSPPRLEEREHRLVLGIQTWCTADPGRARQALEQAIHAPPSSSES